MKMRMRQVAAGTMIIVLLFCSGSLFAAGRFFKPVPGTLAFRDAIPHDHDSLRRGKIPRGRGKFRKPNGDTFYVSEKAILTSKHIQYVHLLPGEYQADTFDLTIYMTPAGMKRIHDYSRRPGIRHLAFLINGELVAAPLNRAPLSYAMTMHRFSGRVLKSLRQALIPISPPDLDALTRRHIAWLKREARARPREDYLRAALAGRYIQLRRCDFARLHLLPLLGRPRSSASNTDYWVIELGSCFYLKFGIKRGRAWYREALAAAAIRFAEDPALEIVLRNGLAQLLTVSGERRSAIAEYRRIIRLARRGGKGDNIFIREIQEEMRKLRDK